MANYSHLGDQFYLGMGLFFSVTNKHIHYKGKWISRSNIPQLEELELGCNTEREAYTMVFELLKQIDVKFTNNF